MSQNKQQAAAVSLSIGDQCMTAIADSNVLSTALGLIVASGFAAILWRSELLSKLGTDSEAGWVGSAGLLMWFFSGGMLDALSVGWTTDPKRQEQMGSRCIVGLAKAVAAMLLLCGGAVYVWMS